MFNKIVNYIILLKHYKIFTSLLLRLSSIFFSYDLISAFETVYFWPDIGETFKEVYRIIKANGQFIIGQGTDGTHPDDEKWLSTVEGMSVYNASELEEYLLGAGFKSVDAFKKDNSHILVVIAHK